MHYWGKRLFFQGSSIALAAFMAACSPPTNPANYQDAAPDVNPDDFESIEVLPPEQVVLVVNDLSQVVQFQALGHRPDGSTQDITSVVEWQTSSAALLEIDDEGSAYAPTQLGGEALVFASLGSMTGNATADVIQRRSVIGPGANETVAAAFDTATVDTSPGRTPRIEYPRDNTVIPPNFAGLEFHFTPGSGNDVFELAFDQDYYQLHYYAGCSVLSGGCMMVPDSTVWDLIGEMFRGKDVTVTVSGTSSTDYLIKTVSAPQQLSFTFDDLTAGLYYWAATDGRIHRFDFGHANVPPEPWYPDDFGNGDCAACHSLSRDGSLMAVNRGIGDVEVIDVETKTLLWSTSAPFTNSVFSPDNSKLIIGGSTVSGPIPMQVYDVATGQLLGFNFTGESESPEWSPDGTMIAYASSFGGGPIKIHSWDGDQFGPAVDLVTSVGGQFPAFTPDSEWIVFNRNGFFEAAALSSNLTVQLNQVGDGTWPKLAPNLMEYSGGEVVFMTFATIRNVGLRQSFATQVWMTAFDPARAAAGQDPSFAPVHLPWQATEHGNHIAQWATDIPHQSCTIDEDCPPLEFCEDRECVPRVE